MESLNVHCEHPSCNTYPHYGRAPNIKFWRKETNITKRSTVKTQPLEEWPSHFLLEINPSEPIKPQLIMVQCGVYYCPHCKQGMPEPSSHLVDKPRLTLILKEEGVIE